MSLSRLVSFFSILFVLALSACTGHIQAVSSDGSPGDSTRENDGLQWSDTLVKFDGHHGHDGSLRDASRVDTIDGGPASDQTTLTDGQGSGSRFRFIAWADTKTGTTALSTLSDQAYPLKPAFSIYPGDLVESWSTTRITAWKKAIDGQLTNDPVYDKNPNGMFKIVFPVRGNHDNSLSGWEKWWQANHPMAQAAADVGATSFTSMSGHANSTYSFDYKNAHFIGLDVPGDVPLITSDSVTWLDKDMSAAEGRGIKHTFLYFHGPIYCVDGHCSCSTGICSSSSRVDALISVLNKHPSISATFHGHEHVYAYTLLNNKRDSRITRPFRQFVTGAAGAGPSSCSKTNRFDYCMSAYGFATVDVDGAKVTVQIYKKDSNQVQKTVSWIQP
ncbi:MAG: metallophosphoesterase [Deltaproteobacteria bacterium]|nr:metallophosphoesterase [Deltaproteobacteria bacterium]